MRARNVFAASALAALCAGTFTLPTATAFAGSISHVEPSPGAAVTDENDCFEVAITRAGDLSATRAVVPSRYSLATVTNPTTGQINSRLFLHTYSCRDLTVDGQPAVGRNRTTTITIGSVGLSGRDGVLLPAGFNSYVLWYGTDNPVLFAKFQQLGLPARLLPTGVSATINQGAGQSIVDWAFEHPGLSYTLHGDGLEMPPAPPGKIRMWFDGPRGDLKLTFLNDAVRQAVLVPVSADLTGLEPLVALLPRDPNGNPIGVVIPAPGVAVARFTYVQGSWQGCLSSMDDNNQANCPAVFS